MNKRFWIICSVIGSGLLVLSILGLSSLGMHEKGLRAERQQEFMEVARQISFDVKKKVDVFLQAEQNRLYTDYQPYYVPEVGNQATALVPSPLADLYSNSFANGYFQLEADGQLTSPHFAEQPTQQALQKKQVADHSVYFDNIRQNLLPSLTNGQTLATHRIEPTERLSTVQYERDKRTSSIRRGRRLKEDVSAMSSSQISQDAVQMVKAETIEPTPKEQPTSKGAASKRSVYPISSLEKKQQTTQILSQRRDNYEANVASNEAVQDDESVSQAVSFYNTSRANSQTAPRQTQRSSFGYQQPAGADMVDEVAQRETESEAEAVRKRVARQQQSDIKKNDMLMMDEMELPGQAESGSQSGPVDQLQTEQADTVQVRIEPFVPTTVSAANGAGNGLFAGQVFLLRHVQIEDRHLVQGFRLNEDELLTQITESAKERLRRGMGYEISKIERPDAAHTAILQFDFGEVILNLLELEPALIQARVLRIRNWFFGILGVVWVSVVAAMAALWKNMRQQVQLSRKKDDFISAVSHELRTPLTSIRMYTEMLEKDWVKTEDKRREYYTTMRTESERLTRLIENVLDFSRIQRGKKRYDFTVGDVNECIGDVTDMMRPYAEQAGFVLEQQFEVMDAFAFDRDAVTQIIINLIDNALKYAKDAPEKYLIIRTRRQDGYAVIEVEDHGPGIGRSDQKKIFDAFYRCEDESTRQNTGTGLGLALVKRFAEAHHGFVQIAAAKPTGALFRIGLATE
ncbi:MAG: sensor histidine kinase [Planctomycetota bacterium]